ncbi:hypothetical protein GL325_06665 [Aeromicrobium sp. 636]|uniref:Transmembrane protein n=1 Tax=Aeromicrobium senzhongii TaxID=2663859 RepID=A0A8I0EUX0_9ACTN|nr:MULTISPECIES: hypothetical protein [Aeromicrobium]MBC9225994.1 hypothetical protein [Aeromicrobium senzhongii]MCQ3998101.1 hypothetical protein [Aeromicrobium sp. 636]MTB88530.1 hypothetical protein [Aeromicrobium senzhongii]QNL94155.1 hypothetical protein H9L21_13875 [Aeromicrobium senzhongii]
MTRGMTWRTILLPVLPWILAIAVAVTQFVVIPDMAADVGGDLTFTAYVVMFGAVIPVAWALLETLWTRTAGSPIHLAFARTLGLSLVMGTVLGLTGSLARLRPGVEDIVVSSRRDDGWHYWFDASRGGGSMLADLPLYLVVNIGASMLVALLLVIFVVLPWFAFVRPRAFLEANMLELHPSVVESNIVAARVMSVLLMLVFAVPTAVVLLSNAEHTALAWTVGVAMTLVGLWLVRVVMRRQVVDEEKWRTLPEWAQGRHTRGSAFRPDDPQY